MFIKINLNEFSIKEIFSHNIYKKNNYVWGNDGRFWLRNNCKINSTNIPPKCYSKTNKKILNSLEGNFLFFLIDLKKKTLEFYSDIIGSIPLYYTFYKKYLICSSDLKSLLNENLQIDANAINFYKNLGYFPAPYTIFKDIKKLNPGYNMLNKNSYFINEEFDFTRKNSIHHCLERMKNNIYNFCKNKKTGILTTGGLDSSLLVYLSKGLNPYLYFIAIIDRIAKDYCIYSIEKCKYLSKIFNLKFEIIPIKKDDYLKGFTQVNKIIDDPIGIDEDLPAVYSIFKKIKQKRNVNCLLSGIGSNEIFNLSRNCLKIFFYKTMPSGISAHKKLADYFNLDFYTPFLNKDLISFALSTPLNKRKNKAPLKDALLSLKALPSQYITQPPLHTPIPQRFTALLSVLFKERHFKQIAFKFWLNKNL